MKIEVCEQMLSAWLKHVKGCQIVQTNWSPSPVFIEAFAENNLDTINGFVEEIKKFAAENNLDIFKQSTIRQMIIQCEIDVIGIKIEDGIIGDLYLIDSAFHENGLNYGDVVARVLKKILRAVFVADGIFKNIPAKIVFASPKCAEHLQKTLRENILVLQETVKRFYPDADILLLFNEDFSEAVYRPLLEKIDLVSDDNDLFLRSVKLCKTAEKYEARKSTVSERTIPVGNTTYRYRDMTKTPKGRNMNIVFGILRGLIDNGLMTRELVEELRRPEFARRQFSLSSFPVLIPETQLRSSGYEECRFYKNNPIEISGTQYLVCSQWIPDRIRRLQTWYNTLTQR